MKILIIEDDSLVRQMLREILEPSGHEVMEAETGASGVQLARRGPDLILCDIGLPDMDGYATLEAIHGIRECRGIPCVFLTGRVSREDQRRAMALGADDFITKPFVHREILEAVEACQRRRQALKEEVERWTAQHQRRLSAQWAHELITPISMILGALDMAENSLEVLSRDELRELLRIMRMGAERQNVLSRKLLTHIDLERQLSAHATGLPGSCAVEAAVAGAVARAVREEGREGDVHTDCEPATLAVAQSSVEDALAELVGNGLKFSPAGHRVEVTGRRSDRSYKIQVQDEGPGMTEAQRASVAPYQQFGRSRHEQQGLGLGLSIADKIAKLSGGRLVLQDAPSGRGLLAELELPASP